MKNKKQNKTKKQVKQTKPVVAKKVAKKEIKKVIVKKVAPKCTKKCAKKCEGKCAKKCAQKVTTKTVKINGKNVPMSVAEKDGFKVTVVGPIPMGMGSVKVPQKKVCEKELEYEVKEMVQISIIMNLARVFDFGPLPKRNALRKISTDRFRQLIGSYARIAKFFGGVYENIKKDYDEFIKIASVWKADSKQK